MAAFEIIALDTDTPQLRAPGAGDTYTAPRAVALTPETLTGSAADSALSVTQTWNTTGTPTALQLDVTDTASNASSLLMDLRVGGSSVVKVNKSGDIIWGRSNSPTVAATNQNLYLLASSASTLATSSGLGLFNSGNEARIDADWGFAWSSTNNIGTTSDLVIRRDAANTLAQRNGTNAQTQRTYGTFTDTSNYRRVALAMTTAGVATLAPEGAGTGASGNVLHISGLPTSNPGAGILWNDAGTVKVGT